MNVHIHADVPTWLIALLFVFALISGLANAPAWLTLSFLVVGAGVTAAR